MQLSFVTGAVVPHAPVLLETIGAAHGETTAAVRSAVRGIDTDDADLLIVISPHGVTTGVYASHRGSLDGFGVSDVVFEATPDPQAAESLAARWGRPLIDEEIDHGAGVAIALLEAHMPTVICAIAEAAAPDDIERAVEDGEKLAAAITELDGRRVFVAASAHGSAALGPRAPLGERAAGPVLDAAIRRALERDPGAIAVIPATKWSDAGACGAGPLSAFARLFAGRSTTLLSYSHPFGVGYFVARVD